MLTVKDLIEQLQEHDPNEPIIYQYFVREFTELDQPEFAEVADYLQDNSVFTDDLSEMFFDWVSNAQDAIATEKEED